MQATAVAVKADGKSQVAMEFGLMDGAVGDLQNVIADMERRLEAVLIPSPPEEKDGGTPEAVLAALPSEIREYRKRIFGSILRIRSLMDRLAI